VRLQTAVSRLKPGFSTACAKARLKPGYGENGHDPHRLKPVARGNAAG
jgi:hypothetical protein